MRHLFFASILAGLFLSVAPVRAATYVVWQGQSIITNTTLPCSASGVGRSEVRVGSTLQTVIRPAMLASNGANSRIAFVHAGQSEFALVLAGGLTIVGPGTYSAYGVTYGGSFKTNVGGVYRDFALTPAAPAPTTPSVSLTGAIDNFMFISGCSVTFRGAYVLRP